MREWNRGKIGERSSNMDDMWREVKVLCKHTCDTLSHAVHVNKVKCERERVPCEVFCLQKPLERPNNIQNDLYTMNNLKNLYGKNISIQNNLEQRKKTQCTSTITVLHLFSRLLGDRTFFLKKKKRTETTEKLIELIFKHQQVDRRCTT